MDRTRLSLLYVIAYLVIGGAALLVTPQLAITLLQSNGTYSDVMLRMVGMFMVSIAIIVGQIVRLRVEMLYPTTLIVRIFLCIGLTALYLVAADPMFLVLLAIVGVGVAITSTTLIWRAGE